LNRHEISTDINLTQLKRGEGTGRNIFLVVRSSGGVAEGIAASHLFGRAVAHDEQSNVSGSLA
jgi:hypothetical protein